MYIYEGRALTNAFLYDRLYLLALPANLGLKTIN
jgi:heme oxygenase